MFSDHREIKLEMNKKKITGKSLSVLEIKISQGSKRKSDKNWKILLID